MENLYQYKYVSKSGTVYKGNVSGKNEDEAYKRFCDIFGDVKREFVTFLLHDD